MIENTTNIIIIKEISYDVMEIVLLYMYTEKVDIKSDFVIEILYTAEKYELLHLKDLGQLYLIDQIDHHNVFEMFVLADFYNTKYLQYLCIKFIATNELQDVSSG